MDVHVADHPLIAHKLTYLRDKRTDSPTFRRLAEELVTLLAYEATRDVRVEPFEIETPVAPTTGHQAVQPQAAHRPDPPGRPRHARRHGEAAAQRRGRLPRHASATRRPSRSRPTRTACPTTSPAARSSSSTRCSPPAARSSTPIDYLVDEGADDITAVCLLAAPEGVKHLEERAARLNIPVKVVLGTIDEKLNEKGYIVPGLGDAGDRLYGVV